MNRKELIYMFNSYAHKTLLRNHSLKLANMSTADLQAAFLDLYALVDLKELNLHPRLNDKYILTLANKPNLELKEKSILENAYTTLYEFTGRNLLLYNSTLGLRDLLQKIEVTPELISIDKLLETLVLKIHYKYSIELDSRATLISELVNRHKITTVYPLNVFSLLKIANPSTSFFHNDQNMYHIFRFYNGENLLKFALVNIDYSIFDTVNLIEDKNEYIIDIQSIDIKEIDSLELAISEIRNIHKYKLNTVEFNKFYGILNDEINW